MKVKFGFKVLDVKLEDATFKVKEMDFKELSLKHIAQADGVSKFDIVGAINDFFRISVIGWDNLIDITTEAKIEYSEVAKEGLHFDLKAAIFNLVSEKSNLKDEEKKN